MVEVLASRWLQSLYLCKMEYFAEEAARCRLAGSIQEAQGYEGLMEDIYCETKRLGMKEDCFLLAEERGRAKAGTFSEASINLDKLESLLDECSIKSRLDGYFNSEEKDRYAWLLKISVQVSGDEELQRLVREMIRSQDRVKFDLICEAMGKMAVEIERTLVSSGK